MMSWTSALTENLPVILNFIVYISDSMLEYYNRQVDKGDHQHCLFVVLSAIAMMKLAEHMYRFTF